MWSLGFHDAGSKPRNVEGQHQFIPVLGVSVQVEWKKEGMRWEYELRSMHAEC
jgi:hypothetical protein